MVTNPTAYYNYNEASGNLLDAFSSTYPLTDNNAVGAGAGIINGARYFTGSSSMFFNSSDPIFRVGDIDYAFAGWFYVADATLRQAIFGKDILTDREYVLLQAGSAANRLTWVVFNGAGTAITATTAVASIANNTWNFYAVYHDAAGDQIGISLNGGAYVTAATGGGHAAGGTLANFCVGRRDFVGANDYVTGREDAGGFWSNYKLPIAEAQELYNGGVGMEWPFGGAAAAAWAHRFSQIMPSAMVG